MACAGRQPMQSVQQICCLFRHSAFAQLVCSFFRIIYNILQYCMGLRFTSSCLMESNDEVYLRHVHRYLFSSVCYGYFRHHGGQCNTMSLVLMFNWSRIDIHNLPEYIPIQSFMRARLSPKLLNPSIISSPCRYLMTRLRFAFAVRSQN